MPTSKQMKDRSTLVHEWTEELAGNSLADFTKNIPYNLRTDVMALALARGYVEVEDIPDNKAGEVLEKFLKKAPDRIRDDKGRIGTAVHEFMEVMANGEMPTVPSKYRGHIEAWRRFMADWQVEVIRTEFTVESVKHGYMGTGDILFRSRNHPEMGVILGDYKSSESGIWPDIALQLAALRYADHILECTALPHDDDYEHKPEDAKIVTGVLETVDSYVGIQITEEGYKVVPANVSTNTFKVFLAAMIVADWKTDREKTALEPAEWVQVK